MRNLVLNFWERLGFAVRLPVGMILAVWGFTCWLAYFDTVKAILGFDSSQDPLLSFHFVGVALAAFVCLVIPYVGIFLFLGGAAYGGLYLWENPYAQVAAVAPALLVIISLGGALLLDAVQGAFRR